MNSTRPVFSSNNKSYCCKESELTIDQFSFYRRGRITEASLFGIAINGQLNSADKTVASRFVKLFRSLKSQHRALTGERSQVASALKALTELVSENLLSQTLASKIVRNAWSLAQLDGNLRNVSKAREMEISPPKRESGIQIFENNLSKFNLGQLEIDSTINLSSLEYLKNVESQNVKNSSYLSEQTLPQKNFGKSPIYQSGFLFKPISDSTGNLVVLLPPNLTGQIASVKVESPSNKTSELGDYKGIGNGGREHFRFQQPGGRYGEQLNVVVTLRNGALHTVTIPNPNLRYEVK